MNTPPLDNLETQLREATTWSGSKADLWKRALASEPESSILSFDVIEFVKRRWFGLTAIGSAACLAIVLMASFSGQFVAVGGRPEIEASLSVRPGAESWKAAAPAASPATGGEGKYAYDVSIQGESHDAERVSWSLQKDIDSGSNLTAAPPTADQTDKPASPVAAKRYVISKATLELSTPDVRGAFLKAGQVLNEGLGEHIQDSSLTGNGDSAYGSLTLRVSSARLGTVLNVLRELGTVASERREGQDVTAQVIDLDARLRNEQRVEQELLQLFDQRKDAPLKDVLDLRQKISEVRSGIEQLVGQRDQLSRLISLATVLVIVRTGEKAVEVPKDGLWHYFGESIGKSWRWGLRCLSDTVAGLLAIFVGGLVWWLLLAIALLLLRRYVRRRAARSNG